MGKFEVSTTSNIRSIGYHRPPTNSTDTWNYRDPPPSAAGCGSLPDVTTTSARTVRLGATDYPVVLPSMRDPRLHLAGVIITIHVLGQVALDFRVSVPQILAAILACAAIEVALTFRRTQQIVWPASAMLTGSGVALILRIVGQERGDHWTLNGWYLFAGIAALSLLTKYWIRYRGTHVFNPSNVGLVAAFLVLGSAVIEPLDFWWAPLDFWMLAAYAVILIGGVLITSRLRLLTLAAVFWLTLAVGLGVLAASGHCMTAAWALQPVCGTYFWSVIVASPEVLIFLFFMITDPKTIPEGRPARIAFACPGVVCTLLMAPQTTEFGAKVGLLAGLVVMTPLRFLFDRVFKSERIGSLAESSKSPADTCLRPGAVVGTLLVLVPLAIVVAGGPARSTAVAPPVAVPTARDRDRPGAASRRHHQRRGRSLARRGGPERRGPWPRPGHSPSKRRRSVAPIPRCCDRPMMPSA